MVTVEMIEYLMSFRRKDLVSALKRADHNGDYDGISKTVAALTLLKWVVEYELDFKELKQLL